MEVKCVRVYVCLFILVTLNMQYYIINMHFISYLTNINLQIQIDNFSEKSAFEPRLLLLRERDIFSNWSFFAKPLCQNVRIDHRIAFTFS